MRDVCVVVRQRTVDMYRRFLWDTCLGGDEVNWESGRKAERVEDRVEGTSHASRTEPRVVTRNATPYAVT